MNNAYGLTAENLLRAFPNALTSDPDKMALASVTANELEQLYNDNELLELYMRIDELDAEILDILANDFKVDWYLYGASLAAKREQIKSSFFVHKHLGTKGAMIQALSDICPGSDLEEWFEYNGRPYYFRILLDVTEQRTPIDQRVVSRLIGIFKPARSVLEHQGIIFRTRNYFVLSLTNGYFIYTVRLCGTYPKAATQGVIDNTDIDVGVTFGKVLYVMPVTGDSTTGTFPKAAVQGSDGNGDIIFDSGGDSAAYTARVCGTPNGSLI